jgi:4,5-dihydroxyphthalate decarboxylase
MPRYAARGPLTLKINFGDSPAYAALRSGAIRSDLVSFDFCAPKSPVDGFKPLVRERAFDCGELAIVTFLQAKTYGKPLALLPATLVGRFQQNALGYNSERGALKASDLNGKRVGVGSYTTTTGVWVRGVLQHEYGVDPAKVTWVVTGDAHLAEYRDPPNVEKAGAGKKLDQMLLDGEIDALISPTLPQDPRVKPLIPDAKAEGEAWGRKYGTVQINHMFVVDQDLLRERPDAVKEIYRLLAEARRGASVSGPVDMLPFGAAARPGVDLMGQYAEEQKIVPRRYTADELFAETARAIS